MARMRIPFPMPRRRGGSRRMPGMGGRSSFKARLIIALAIAAFALLSYYGKPKDQNLVTGDRERVAILEEDQEIQLGLQAAPQLVQQHGGPTSRSVHQERVNRIGFRLLTALERELQEKGRSNPYREAFQFTLLSDPKLVNAFALPGGQVFITEALYNQLETEGQVAGVLGHEIGHVIMRHGNKQMAKQGLFQGLAGAAGVLGGSEESARAAQMVSHVLSMKYGREAELESDHWGVRLCAMGGYDPRSMIGVMKVLEEAGGGGGTPEFFSTHPKPANRVEYIKQVIQEEFPNGVPDELID